MNASYSELNFKPASIFRRLGAILYDTLIAFGILFFATAIAMLFHFHQNKYLFLIYLILILGSYFVWSWRTGQSLGMMAWKLKLLTTQSQIPSFSKSWLRFILGLIGCYCFGLTLIWCFFDKNKQSLHDRLAGTILVCRN